MESLEVVGVRDVTLVRYRLPKLCRELRHEVACRIIGHIRFTRIRMVHHQFATKQVVCIPTANIQLYFVNESLDHGKTGKDRVRCSVNVTKRKTSKPLIKF